MTSPTQDCLTDTNFKNSIHTSQTFSRCREPFQFTVFEIFLHNQAPVVRRLNNAIHQIDHKINHAIHWIVIYPVDGIIQINKINK